MNITGLFATLIPVFFVLLLGFAAGKLHNFAPEQASGLSKLALGFALPASLLDGMSSIPKQLLIAQWQLACLLLIVHLGLLGVVYLALRYVVHVDMAVSALYALVLSTSATPVFGISVLSPLLGPTSIGTVGLVALAINFTVPVAVILLEVAAASDTGATGGLQHDQPARKAGSNPVWAGMRSGLQSPLLWAPVLGVTSVLAGVHFPIIVRNSLNFIGSATSGVAVFAVGLTLAAHAIMLSRTIVLGTLGRLGLQTALLFLGLQLFHITGPFAREALVCCSFPSATITVLLAAKYRRAEAEIASILALSTLSLVISVPVTLHLAR
jgi:malonate transporter and related proteins